MALSAAWLVVIVFVVCNGAKLPSVQVLMEILHTKYQGLGFLFILRIDLLTGSGSAGCKGNEPHWPVWVFSEITAPTPIGEVSAAGDKGNEESSAKTRDEARLT